MLFNYYTVDACFLSSSFHITSKSMFAGVLFGVFFLCMAIEGVRRLGREYDRRLIAAARAAPALSSAVTPLVSGQAKDDGDTCAPAV